MEPPLKNQNSIPPRDQKQMPQKVRALRTYEADIQEAIKKEQISMTKIALAEQARGQNQNSGDKKSSLKKWLIIGGIVLPLGVIGFIIYQSAKNNQKTVEIYQALKPELLIAVDSTKDIKLKDSKRSSLTEAIQKEAAAPLSISTVRGLYFEESTALFVSGKRFLRILESELPENLSRTLQNSFTTGIHAFDGNHFFIILKVDSYDSAFTGMVAWEKDMAQKFMPLLNGRLIESSENTSFKDGLIKNKDVRVLKSKDNKLLIVYAFIDRETILITNNEFTVEEITKRINAAKLER